MGAAYAEFNQLSKRYGKGSNVLSGIDFSASKGDFVSIVGQSGCGKSTWLKLMAGLTAPSEGEALICQKPPAKARSELSYIFQDANLLPWLNVRSNIELPLKISGVDALQRKVISSSLLEMVGLEHIGGRYPRQLSGGMKMRVSLARALSIKPELLLMDEPFGSLDAITRNRLNEELLALRENHAFTAFFVTHSVSEAVFLSNRVIILTSNPGQIFTEIEIPLPYPRTAETREREDFQRLVGEVNRQLHAIET